MVTIARYLIVFGILMILIGGIFFLAVRFGISPSKIPLGRLPGDIRLEGKYFTCLLPIASSLLISILLTFLLNVIVRSLNK